MHFVQRIKEKILVITVDVQTKIQTEHLRNISTALPLCKAVCTFISLNVHSYLILCFSVESPLIYYFIPMVPWPIYGFNLF